MQELTPPWLRLFQLSSSYPWWLPWRHAPARCDQCTQRVAFTVWTRPRVNVHSHNMLCLGCGFTQVGYVYRDGGKRDTPVSGSEWSPPCVAVARLRRAIFDQQHIWAPPAPPTLSDAEEEDDDDVSPSGSSDADLLTASEIERLLRVCSNRAPTGIRNRAMVAVAWRSGLRIGEVLALRLKDVDLDGGTLVVQHGKGDKRRVVGIDAGTGALLARWIEVRGRRGINGHAPVFCTLDGGEIDQSSVRHLLPRLARRASIEKRVHAHALRHVYAIELEREGATLSTIRDLLGHSSASVTDRYLRRLGAGEAVDFARQRTWDGV